MTVTPQQYALPGPREYLVVDVETKAGKPQDVERDFLRDWRPNLGWKNETIGRRFHETFEKAKERGALLDSAEVVIIALRTPHDLTILHALGQEAPRSMEGATVWGFQERDAMLLTLRAWLDTYVDEATVLVGHNLRFDLVKLRHSYIRAGLQLPAALVFPGQPHCCTMDLFCRRFSLTDRKMISLAEASETLGLTHHKGLLDGSKVGELIERGEIPLLLKYAVLDALCEETLFLAMTGQTAGLK